MAQGCIAPCPYSLQDPAILKTLRIVHRLRVVSLLRISSVQQAGVYHSGQNDYIHKCLFWAVVSEICKKGIT